MVFSQSSLQEMLEYNIEKSFSDFFEQQASFVKQFVIKNCAIFKHVSQGHICLPISGNTAPSYSEELPIV